MVPEPPRGIRLPNGRRVGIRTVGTTRNGLLDVPDDIELAGWWSGGSRLGDPFGSTLVAAHVDSRTQGLGPFASLLGVRAGDRVHVWSDGLRQTFEITSLRLRPQGTLGPGSYLHSPDGPPPPHPGHLRRTVRRGARRLPEPRRHHRDAARQRAGGGRDPRAQGARRGARWSWRWSCSASGRSPGTTTDEPADAPSVAAHRAATYLRRPPDAPAEGMYVLSYGHRRRHGRGRRRGSACRDADLRAAHDHHATPTCCPARRSRSTCRSTTSTAGCSRTATASAPTRSGSACASPPPTSTSATPSTARMDDASQTVQGRTLARVLGMDVDYAGAGGVVRRVVTCDRHRPERRLHPPDRRLRRVAAPLRQAHRRRRLGCRPPRRRLARPAAGPAGGLTPQADKGRRQAISGTCR